MEECPQNFVASPIPVEKCQELKPQDSRIALLAKMAKVLNRSL